MPSGQELADAVQWTSSTLGLGAVLKAAAVNPHHKWLSNPDGVREPMHATTAGSDQLHGCGDTVCVTSTSPYAARRHGLAWLWLRYQPESALAAWFRARVGTLAGRARRIAIVAMARKLLIALWRYAETGQIPEGVNVRAAA